MLDADGGDGFQLLAVEDLAERVVTIFEAAVGKSVVF